MENFIDGNKVKIIEGGCGISFANEPHFLSDTFEILGNVGGLYLVKSISSDFLLNKGADGKGVVFIPEECLSKVSE